MNWLKNKYLLSALITLLAIQHLYAESTNPALIFDKNHNSSQHIAQKIAQAMNQSESTTASKTAISIGNKSALSLHKDSDYEHQIYSFVNHQIFNQGIDEKANNYQAIMLYPDINLMINAGHHIHPIGTDSKITLLISESNYLKQSLIALSKQDSSINIMVVNPDKLDHEALKSAIFHASTLIAIPDNELWVGQNARWLLHQAFEYKIPVIGYSKSFLEAGALIAIYTTSQAIIDATKKAWTSNTNQHIIYPEAMIRINPSIAKVFGYDIDDLETQLRTPHE